MNPIKEIVIKCEKCHTLGVYYDERRIENFNYSRKYKPGKVKVLWILESPPLSDPPRYFYRHELTKYDGLFREMMKVLNIPISNPKDKSLQRFSELGHFLIDAMKCPADKSNAHLKPAMISNCSSILAQETLEINPELIIIVKADIYSKVYDTVASINMTDRVLNTKIVPYPGSGNQTRFKSEIEKLLKLNRTKTNTTNTKPMIPTTYGKSILVDNITENDVSNNQLRITVDNKHLFPAEKIGQPMVYNLQLVFTGSRYNCKYRIGSNDGKSRSGVLKLGSELASHLHLHTNNSITIERLSGGLYEIKKYQISIIV
jgi:hypothetical protein